MGSLKHGYISIILAALLAHSAHAVPTANRLETRQDIVTIDPSKIIPEVIEHGPLDEAAIAKLVANVTGSTKQARSKYAKSSLHSRQTQTTNGPFLSYMNGFALPGADPKCPEFLAEGPILELEASMGSTNIRGLKLTSIAGNTTEITGAENVVSPAPGAFTFGANERITEFVIHESDNIVSGFSFKTDAGNSYSALSLAAQNGEGIKLVSIPVGSGIIARIRGTDCEVGVFGSFGIDFLDDLASIQISNMTYSGFTNNIAPGGDGTLVTVGSQVLDNRNSSVQQQMTLAIAQATTKQYSINTNTNWNVGGGVSVTTSASIPFIAKTEVTTQANFQLGGATDNTEMTATTKTNTATFQLNCPAKKFCLGSATFLTFKIDVNLEATFAATTKSGHTYNWVQSGTYKGSDSLTMKLTVDEADNAS